MIGMEWNPLLFLAINSYGPYAFILFDVIINWGDIKMILGFSMNKCKIAFVNNPLAAVGKENTTKMLNSRLQKVLMAIS